MGASVVLNIIYLYEVNIVYLYNKSPRDSDCVSTVLVCACAQIVSPFSGTVYAPESAGKTCNVDKVAEIGKDVSGLRISFSSR